MITIISSPANRNAARLMRPEKPKKSQRNWLVGKAGLRLVATSRLPHAGATIQDQAPGDMAFLRWYGRPRRSIPQQLVDRGLGARLLVDALDDDGAVEAGSRPAVGE